jgi:hypothetical protein
MKRYRGFARMSADQNPTRAKSREDGVAGVVLCRFCDCRNVSSTLPSAYARAFVREEELSSIALRPNFLQSPSHKTGSSETLVKSCPDTCFVGKRLTAHRLMFYDWGLEENDPDEAVTEYLSLLQLAQMTNFALRPFINALRSILTNWYEANIEGTRCQIASERITGLLPVSWV